MFITYEANDTVIHVPTGVRYVVAQAVLKVHRDEVPVRSEQRVRMVGLPQDQWFSGDELMPAVEAMVLTSWDGKVHGAMLALVPPLDQDTPLNDDRHAPGYASLADSYNQRVTCTASFNVAWVATPDAAEAFIRECNGDEADDNDEDQDENGCPECRRSFGPHYDGPCSHA